MTILQRTALLLIMIILTIVLIVIMSATLKMGHAATISILKFKNEYWFNTFEQQNEINFKIKSNHQYEFKTFLDDKQYVFIFYGEEPFSVTLIEPSGNKLEANYSINNQVVVIENIMESGIYTLLIQSKNKNFIKAIWGIY